MIIYLYKIYVYMYIYFVAENLIKILYRLSTLSITDTYPNLRSYFYASF